MPRTVFALAGSVLLSVSLSPAGVVRIDVERREPVLEGRSFGLAGPYEKLVGKIHFAVDPANPANSMIADIERAPRNARGQVECSADFYLLKPVDPGRGNRTLLFEVSNRGNKGMLGMFNLASSSREPTTEAHFGDGFLLRRGYTLGWVGWQFDPPREEGRMRLSAPVAKAADGSPIRGLARADFVVEDRLFDHLLSDREHIPYPAADPSDERNVLTVRERVEADRRVIPRSEWKFARMEDGKAVADRTRVYLAAGFEPGKIYELVYVVENPALVGLGPAVVRDFVALLKYEGSDELGLSAEAIERAIGFGVSQSGRFLRTFLYYGFNRDEHGRRSFDGVIAHVAGGGRGSFNHRFAQPSRDAHPFMNFFYPTDIFPFSDVKQKDPETGLEDGLLAHYEDAELLPKIFYTNSSYEYWGRAASLIHTTLDGGADVDPPENVRIYQFAGSQHGPARFPPAPTSGRQPSNPLNFRWAMRALLEAMRSWVEAGEQPPASRYPRVADGSLVDWRELRFPKLKGVAGPAQPHWAYRADYGPRFQARGIVDHQPPKIGSRFGVRVPQVDEDGNEIAGIRLPAAAVPLATYTGWNLFREGKGPVDELSSMQGSFIPFPRTRSDEDPRRSIAERYPTAAHYLGRVTGAALELEREGYLLSEDVPAILREAERYWQYLTAE